MLTIRKEQMAVMDAAMMKRFEDRTVLHLRRVFPEKSEAMADDQLRGMVRTGHRKAAGYDITTERDVTLFVDLMMEFGADFDTNGKHGWMQQWLTEPGLSGRARMDVIYQDLAGRDARWA